MADTEFPPRDIGNTRDDHLLDHNRLHTQNSNVVYSGHFATLQEAVDAAIARGRPLVIAPGVHTLTAPLVIDRGYHLHIQAYGARIYAGANLTALVEMRDCVRCTWRGGWLWTTDNYTVGTMLYIYREDGQCTRNAIYDVNIDGHYTIGVRIGRATDPGQCDHMLLQNVECTGASITAGRIGYYIGTGVYGNCLNHVVQHVLAAFHDTHVYIDATNVEMTGVYCSMANTDFFVSASQFHVSGVRSEGSERFFVTAGPAGYGANLSVENVLWPAQELHADGQWIIGRLSGVLSLRNVTLYDAPDGVTPVIRGDPGVGLLLDIDGLVSTSTAANAVSATAKVQVSLRNYAQIGAGGSLIGITP